MNKLIGSIVLGASLFIPTLAGAATFTLGSFPGATGFSDADLNTGSVPPRNQLPANGPFSDDWNFTVGPNSGGAANVTITGIGSLNLSDLNAVILGAGNFSLLFSNVNNQLLGLNFGALDPGNYTLQVTGNTFGSTTDSHSYSGNLSISNGVAAVPVPGAVWLFGSAIVGLIGISKRKKG
ncbi:MAG: hypothetical protein HOP02_06430 [Methylococcaceae bacterium]|nr:hypothetical protein [Methylococcaceae bacterium]